MYVVLAIISLQLPVSSSICGITTMAFTVPRSLSSGFLDVALELTCFVVNWFLRRSNFGYPQLVCVVRIRSSSSAPGPRYFFPVPLFGLRILLLILFTLTIFQIYYFFKWGCEENRSQTNNHESNYRSVPLDQRGMSCQKSNFNPW